MPPNSSTSPPPTRRRYSADDLNRGSPPRVGADFLMSKPPAKLNTPSIALPDLLVNNSSQKPRNDITYDYAVIGTGFAGASAAVALAEEGKKVLAINVGDQVADEDSTSANQTSRAHLGTHYVGDLESAMQILDDSLALAKTHPDFFIENSKTGLYIFVDNTLVPLEIVRENAELLREHYRKECNATTAPAPFGHPDAFIEYLEPSTIPFVPNSIPYRGKTGEIERYIKPVLAFRVPEPLVDIKKVRKHFKDRFKDLKSNLSFLPGHKVINVAKTNGSLDYAVEAMDLKSIPQVGKSKPTTIFRAKSIVLCAWQNNEVLLERLGLFSSALENVIIRPKVSLTVKLPEVLFNAESRIFGVGPHFSFANNGDGTATVTHEWSTAAGERKAGSLELPPEIKELYNTKLVPDQGKGKEFKEKIMAGAIGYLEELADATVTKVSLAHVKMIISPKEDCSLDGKDSAIHKRSGDGLGEVAPGVIAFSGMKMVKALTRNETIKSLATTNSLDLKELDKVATLVKEILVLNKIKIHVANVLAFSTFIFPLIEKLKEKDGKGKDNYERIRNANHDDKKAIREKISTEFVKGILGDVTTKKTIIDELTKCNLKSSLHAPKSRNDTLPLSLN